MHRTLKWEIPTPTNYFNGLRMSNLILADNILFFHRTTRSFLNVRNFESRPHHRFVLIINHQTKGKINVDGDTFNLEPGKAFLITPLQFHFYHDIPDETISWLYMTFESDQPEKIFALKNLPIELDQEDWRILDTILSDYKNLENQLHGSALQNIDTNTWILQCNRFLQRLLAHAKENVSPKIKGASAGAKSDQMIQKVHEFLEADPDQACDLDSLAKSLHISASHLRRRFRNLTGLSLGNYQIHYRMNRAIKYLVNTDTPLSEIAEISGYNSLSAFSRSFKQLFGVNPSEYRKNQS